MKVLGLTGGVGMGKTTAAQMFTAAGTKVLDTDLLARQLVEPGQPALAEIIACFGSAFIDSLGRLRRLDLARVVFADSSRRVQLEQILHPRIRAAWQQQILDWRTSGERLGVVVIPLLFETQVESHFDRILCAACLPDTQRTRLAARGWTAEQASQRIAAQLPIEQKITRSQHVIWTEGCLACTSRQIERILGGM